MHKDMSIPHLASGLMKRIVVAAETGRHVRRGEEVPLQIVGPRVIRTLDAFDEMSFDAFAQPRAAMTAHVEQRANPLRRVARDDDALVADSAREVIARLRNLIAASGADPSIEVEALELAAVELGIRIEFPRQR